MMMSEQWWWHGTALTSGQDHPFILCFCGKLPRKSRELLIQPRRPFVVLHTPVVQITNK